MLLSKAFPDISRRRNLIENICYYGSHNHALSSLIFHEPHICELSCRWIILLSIECETPISYILLITKESEYPLTRKKMKNWCCGIHTRELYFLQKEVWKFSMGLHTNIHYAIHLQTDIWNIISFFPSDYFCYIKDLNIKSRCILFLPL